MARARRPSPRERYTHPELREQLRQHILQGDKGGAPGQWSARKAQLLALEYKRLGGGYLGEKTAGQKQLDAWTRAQERGDHGTD